jgi:hypothetical protein
MIKQGISSNALTISLSDGTISNSSAAIDLIVTVGGNGCRVAAIVNGAITAAVAAVVNEFNRCGGYRVNIAGVPTDGFCLIKIFNSLIHNARGAV